MVRVVGRRLLGGGEGVVGRVPPPDLCLSPGHHVQAAREGGARLVYGQVVHLAQLPRGLVRHPARHTRLPVLRDGRQAAVLRLESTVGHAVGLFMEAVAARDEVVDAAGVVAAAARVVLKAVVVAVVVAAADGGAALAGPDPRVQGVVQTQGDLPEFPLHDAAPLVAALTLQVRQAAAPYPVGQPGGGWPQPGGVLRRLPLQRAVVAQLQVPALLSVGAGRSRRLLHLVPEGGHEGGQRLVRRCRGRGGGGGGGGGRRSDSGVRLRRQVVEVVAGAGVLHHGVEIVTLAADAVAVLPRQRVLRLTILLAKLNTTNTTDTNATTTTNTTGSGVRKVPRRAITAVRRRGYSRNSRAGTLDIAVHVCLDVEVPRSVAGFGRVASRRVAVPTTTTTACPSAVAADTVVERDPRSSVTSSPGSHLAHGASSVAGQRGQAVDVGHVVVEVGRVRVLRAGLGVGRVVVRRHVPGAVVHGVQVAWRGFTTVSAATARAGGQLRHLQAVAVAAAAAAVEGGVLDDLVVLDHEERLPQRHVVQDAELPALLDGQAEPERDPQHHVAHLAHQPRQHQAVLRGPVQRHQVVDHGAFAGGEGHEGRHGARVGNVALAAAVHHDRLLDKALRVAVLALDDAELLGEVVRAVLEDGHGGEEHDGGAGYVQGQGGGAGQRQLHVDVDVAVVAHLVQAAEGRVAEGRRQGQGQQLQGEHDGQDLVRVPATCNRSELCS